MLLKFAIILILHFSHFELFECATIREMIERRGPPKSTPFQTSFSEIDSYHDHMRLEKQLRQTYNPLYPDREVEFVIPLHNAKLEPKVYFTNDVKAAIEKINGSKLTSASNKKMQLELLLNYNKVIVCEWEKPLPKPFDDVCDEDEVKKVVANQKFLEEQGEGLILRALAELANLMGIGRLESGKSYYVNMPAEKNLEPLK